MSIFFPPNQSIVFLNMAILGLVLGIVYDIFSVKRIIFGCHFLLCLFDDVLYTLICGFSFIIGVFITNNGNLRWYEFICCFMGFMLYKCTLSKPFMYFMRCFIGIINLLVRKILYFIAFIIKPIIIPLKVMLTIIICILTDICKMILLFFVKKRIFNSYKKLCRVGK